MNKLVATTLESKIHVFDMKTQHAEKGFVSVTEKVMIDSRIFRQIVCFSLRHITQPCGLDVISRRIVMYS